MCYLLRLRYIVNLVMLDSSRKDHERLLRAIIKLPIFSKGQGYSLPADVQYVDTRWDVPVVLPLHDCLAQELSLLCELDRQDKCSLLSLVVCYPQQCLLF